MGGIDRSGEWPLDGRGRVRKIVHGLQAKALHFGDHVMDKDLLAPDKTRQVDRAGAGAGPPQRGRFHDPNELRDVPRTPPPPPGDPGRPRRGGGRRAADAPAPGQEFLQFVRARAAALRADDAPPRSLDDWNARRPVVRARLAEALGTVPDAPPPLEPQAHGVLDRDGYRVEKVIFQTLPGVRMTANLYVPRRRADSAAILAVHGHWRGAKQDPVVQSRCIGAAKLGFVVLVRRRLRRRRARRRQGARRVPRRDDRRDALARRLRRCRACRSTRTAGPSITSASRPEVDPRPDRHHRGQRRRQPDDVRRRAGSTASRPPSRSARSATTRRTSGPPAACARWSPAP